MSATEAIKVERTVPGVGTIYFTETDKRHEYRFLPEGGQRTRPVPSVTSILRQTWVKPELLDWYAREGAQAEATLANASMRGKAVHRFVEVFMKTGDLLPWDTFPAEFHGYLQGIARFLWDFQPAPIAVERLVIHPEMHYAGRLDLIAAIDEAPTLLDFKSNARGRVYNEAHVQAHAYRMADDRCHGGGIDGVLLVGVSEAGEYTPVAGVDALKVWDAAVDFYRMRQRFERDLAK